MLTQYWDQHGLPFDPANTDHAKRPTPSPRSPTADFRLRTQVARVMSINQPETITPDAVHAAGQILVIGSH